MAGGSNAVVDANNEAAFFIVHIVLDPIAMVANELTFDFNVGKRMRVQIRENREGPQLDLWRSSDPWLPALVICPRYLTLELFIFLNSN